MVALATPVPGGIPAVIVHKADLAGLFARLEEAALERISHGRRQASAFLVERGKEELAFVHGMVRLYLPDYPIVVDAHGDLLATHRRDAA